MQGHSKPTIQTGRLVVNLGTRAVTVDDKPVHLTGKEYDILELLSLRKGTTLTKEMLLIHLYGGMEEPKLKIFDIFVCKLRKKLAQATGGKHYIETVWGRGWVLCDPMSPEPGDAPCSLPGAAAAGIVANPNHCLSGRQYPRRPRAERRGRWADEAGLSLEPPATRSRRSNPRLGCATSSRGSSSDGLRAGLIRGRRSRPCQASPPTTCRSEIASVRRHLGSVSSARETNGGNGWIASFGGATVVVPINNLWWPC
jgi:DNA-binding winged helix-turn-helix (wHTH) protein